MADLLATLETLGFDGRSVCPLAGDASTRRFYRITLADGSTVVVAEYRHGEEASAARDAAVQVWALDRSLPVPPLLAKGPRLLISADLGDEDLERALDGRGAAVLGGAVEALGTFQATPWQDAPTPAFDAAFFRAELTGFERLCPPPARADAGAASRFLDRLAERLAEHPCRLVHRDFHANNLFFAGGRVWAVDFQDMRGGPDTYDLASLLRERAGARLSPDDEAAWCRRAAEAFSWPGDWRKRYAECAAQRGLKVIATFLRLSASGRPAYLRWLPDVRRRTAAVLRGLDAPRELVARVEGPRG